LGWRYRDADRTTALQDALRFAVREEAPPQRLTDYQTAALDDARKDPGWTSWGREGRGGGTQILYKEYLAGGCFRVALDLAPAAPVSLNDLAEALQQPARPLFLGRKSCPPSGPILEPTRVSAANPLAALLQLPASPGALERLRCWCDAGDLDGRAGQTSDVWDRRDFRSNRFLGARQIVETWLAVEELPPAVSGSVA